ncbi:LOW QUALITY PROTEIN: uncharacterized protein ACDL77_017667 [Rhynchocyon petersi]
MTRRFLFGILANFMYCGTPTIQARPVCRPSDRRSVRPKPAWVPPELLGGCPPQKTLGPSVDPSLLSELSWVSGSSSLVEPGNQRKTTHVDFFEPQRGVVSDAWDTDSTPMMMMKKKKKKPKQKRYSQPQAGGLGDNDNTNDPKSHSFAAHSKKSGVFCSQSGTVGPEHGPSFRENREKECVVDSRAATLVVDDFVSERLRAPLCPSEEPPKTKVSSQPSLRSQPEVKGNKAIPMNQDKSLLHDECKPQPVPPLKSVLNSQGISLPNLKDPLSEISACPVETPLEIRPKESCSPEINGASASPTVALDDRKGKNVDAKSFEPGTLWESKTSTVLDSAVTEPAATVIDGSRQGQVQGVELGPLVLPEKSKTDAAKGRTAVTDKPNKRSDDGKSKKVKNNFPEKYILENKIHGAETHVPMETTGDHRLEGLGYVDENRNITFTCPRTSSGLMNKSSPPEAMESTAFGKASTSTPQVIKEGDFCPGTLAESGQEVALAQISELVVVANCSKDKVPDQEKPKTPSALVPSTDIGVARVSSADLETLKSHGARDYKNKGELADAMKNESGMEGGHVVGKSESLCSAYR